ncbi:hypothetical protein MLD38_040427 [Melastoma candidum]|uniref:Uncharacterized protein n=1 Tax=Melastoma candidum TaxID=119954 RepID=A0ACB9L565_9MYRT|nr:hypothetical protein MLD38_040427 [Melastoma candidum]
MGIGADKKWLFTLFSAAFLSLSLLLLLSVSSFISPKPFPSIINHGPHHPPSFSYYISGGRGDKDRILRLLLAVYHPRNRYLLHLGKEADDSERVRLASAVRAIPTIRSFGNVDVLGKADPVTYMGSTNLAAILRGAAVLLKMDDLSHAFSFLKRDTNFIDHTGDLGWKEKQRIQPIIVDPGLYLARRVQIFYATEVRATPDSFKIFTGSPWVILSRGFLEYCVLGWDNLPRTLLMYFNNVMLSQESYFQSVACNSQEFKNSTVNSDLRFMMWDNPPKMEPLFLNSSDYEQMINSGAAFARRFEMGDHVLDMIDEKILQRGRHRVVPGAWCTGRSSWLTDPCSQWGNVNVLKPGPQAKKLEDAVSNLMDDLKSQVNQCK